MPAEIRKRNEKRAVEFADVWRTARLEEARKLLEAWNKAGTPPEKWAFLAREAASIVSGWKGSPEREKAIPPLREIFVKARTELFLAGDEGSLFHAAKFKKLSGGVIELGYDFSTGDQKKIFVPVTEKGSSIRWHEKEKTLELKGEFRFAHGDPFRDYLACAGEVLSCPARAPNVNIALWTIVDDAVSIDLGKFNAGAWVGRMNMQIRCEYLVVGIGYRITLKLGNVLGRGPGRSGQPIPGLPAGIASVGPIYIREPALVIMGGEHGRDLGWGPRQLLWSAGAGKLLKTPFPFMVELKRGVLRWSVRGRKVPFKRTSKLSALRKTLSDRGSLSLFTNGSAVAFSSLLVRGKLNEDWVAGEAVRVAQEEWEEVVKR